MAKAIANKNISAKYLSDLVSQKVNEGKELFNQLTPDKKLLKKYESLLKQKIATLQNAAQIEELIKPIRNKLEKSCVKPLEAKSLQEFSQRVVDVLRVQAKKQKKVLEKKLGKKLPVAKKKKVARKPRAKKAVA